MEQTGNLHLKQSSGNNSESIKARVVLLVRDTLSRPVLRTVKILNIGTYMPKQTV